MCSINECGRYCVRIMMSKTPEFTQLESVKSSMRYFPANGTAGFARRSVRTPSRCPSPPARMTARVLTAVLRPRSRGGTAAASKPQRLAVELFVFCGRSIPREVLTHPAPLDLVPLFAFSVHLERARERVADRPRIVAVEKNPRSPRFAEVGDRVRQTSGPSRDRDRAVTHGDHLRQAARLVAGRDQDAVRAAVDLAGVRRIEAKAHARPARERELEAGEPALDRGVAAAEHDELPARLEPESESGKSDVESLLGVEARHHREEERRLLPPETRLYL